MATDATSVTDTDPFLITGEMLRRPPSPGRVSALLNWNSGSDRRVVVTDESDGGVGVAMALGDVPPVGRTVALRFMDGETRQASVRHVVPDGGCVRLELAWAVEH
jgi:hypothetical protein